MRPTRHSVLSSGSSSSSNASYIDCAFVSPPPEPIEEEDTFSDDRFIRFPHHPPLRSTRTLQIIPTLPPTRHQRRNYAPKRRELSASTSALNAMMSPPESSAMKGNQLIKQHSEVTGVFRQSKTLGRNTPHPHQMHPRDFRQPEGTMTLARRNVEHRSPLDARYSMSDIVIPTPMRPSGSIHITGPVPPQAPPPVISEQAEVSRLKRRSAIKRKSLLDLGLEGDTYDVSEYFSVAASHAIYVEVLF